MSYISQYTSFTFLAFKFVLMLFLFFISSLIREYILYNLNPLLFLKICFDPFDFLISRFNLKRVYILQKLLRVVISIYWGKFINFLIYIYPIFMIFNEEILDLFIFPFSSVKFLIF